MFGFSVGQQNVDRISRRVGNAVGNRPIAGGRNVRSADSNMFRIHERTGKVPQPMWVGVCVIVDIRQDFSGRCPESRIPRGSQTLIFGCDDSETVAMGDLCSGIR
jgi:hypothetical protein